MFKLVALIFLMANGEPEYFGKMRNNRTFDTIAQCEAYLASPNGITSKIGLNAMLASDPEQREFTATFKCEPEVQPSDGDPA